MRVGRPNQQDPDRVERRRAVQTPRWRERMRLPGQLRFLVIALSLLLIVSLVRFILEG
ncbi:MAG: hypothetical protein AAF220_03770 [Pseudomonadota bacterium]